MYWKLSHSASFIDPKLWSKVPSEIKNSKSLQEFKARIKSWVPKNCPCKICKLFIKHVGNLTLFVCFITTISMLFSSFFSFNCEHENKQSNFIVSCYWDPRNGARIIYLFICSSVIFLTVTGRNKITLVIFMGNRFFKTYLIVNIFKVCF